MDTAVLRRLSEYNEQLTLDLQQQCSSTTHKKDMYITNIVSLAHLGYPLILEDIAAGVYGKYSNRVFPAVTSRNQETKTTFEYFEAGSMINTGAHSEEHCLYAWQLTAWRLSEILNKHVLITDIEITNVVTACSLGYRLDMDKVDRLYMNINGGRRDSGFPGMKLGQKDLKVTYIVFANGNVNCTGIKPPLSIKVVYQRAQDLLECCKIDDDEMV